MTFNKKLIALAVALTCVSSTFAMDVNEQNTPSKSGWTIPLPNSFSYSDLRDYAMEIAEGAKAGIAARKQAIADYGYEKATVVKTATTTRLLRIAQFGADKTVYLVTTAEAYTGIPGRLTQLTLYIDSTLEPLDAAYTRGYYASLRGKLVQAKATLIDPLLQKKHSN